MLKMKNELCSLFLLLFILIVIQALGCSSDDCTPVLSQEYEQYRVTVSGGSSPSDVSTYTEDRNSRTTVVITPNLPEPDDGWKYVVYFEFMDIDGTSFLGVPGGLYENPQCVDPADQPLQESFHKLLEQGYAIILTSEWSWDNLFYLPCSSVDPEDGCWFEENPDLLYWQALFERIRTNTLVADVKFNYDQMALIGQSVGAQMASRAMDVFPTLLTTSGNPLPDLKAVAMIAGGSLYCYLYYGVEPKPQFFSDNYTPCDRPDLGCCPLRLTSPRFDGGLEWSSHPPTILIQHENDSYADPKASVYYFEILYENDVEAELYRPAGTLHVMAPEKVTDLVTFLSFHLGD